MRRQANCRTSLLLAVCVLTACQKDADPDTHAEQAPPAEFELPPEVLAGIEDIALKQSQSLADATIIVHRVFELQEDVDLTADNKLVAVDVEFRNFAENLDLDDIEIVDAATRSSLTYCSDIRPLKANGSFQQNRAAWDAQTDAFRVLLVFLTPSDLKTVQLKYWEQELVDEPLPITEGELQYDEGRVVEGLQFWKWPQSYHTGGCWQFDRWLIAGLSDHAAVIDLQVWPPEITHWECGLLWDIEKAPQGGWIVISRNITPDGDYQFPIWHHAAERPGASKRPEPAAVPDDVLNGIVVIGDEVFAYDDDSLYEFVPRTETDLPRLELVEDIPKAIGFKNVLDSDDFAHAQLTTGSGERLLLWDGRGYAREGGRFVASWPQEIREDSYEFCTLPAGDAGFYYVSTEGRGIVEVRPDATARRVMTGVENVLSIQSGPDDTVLFQLGDNQGGYMAGVWYPQNDRYLLLEPAEIDPKVEPYQLDSLHWSAATERFYLLSSGGVFTFPQGVLLDRKAAQLDRSAHE